MERNSVKESLMWTKLVLNRWKTAGKNEGRVGTCYCFCIQLVTLVLVQGVQKWDSGFYSIWRDRNEMGESKAGFDGDTRMET